MATATIKSTYLRGIRDGAPFLLMAVPFAIFFGVVSVEAGLSLSQIMGFTVLVIAGASQFAALQLMLEDAAIVLVLTGALAVNLRMAMYSAALVPHLGPAPLWQRALVAYVNFDQSYMLSVAEYDRRPAMSVAQKITYFLGVASLIAPLWIASTLVGAMVGQNLPDAFALDFIVPIMFMAMVAPGLKTRAHWAAAITATLLSLALRGLPAGIGLLFAAIAAMIVGALVETWAAQE